MTPGWHVLGFDYDAVVGANQDWRLAQELVRALLAAGEPLSEVWEAPGDERHLLLWFVSNRVGRILDEHGVGWRRFLIGSAERLPAMVHGPLKPS